MLVNALHLKGMYEEALEAMKEAAIARGDRDVEEALVRGSTEAGYAEAMRGVAEILAARSRHTYVASSGVALLYLRAGQKEPALEWLERAYQERDPDLPYLGWPGWDSLRADPRFQDIRRWMKLPD